ncbi:hypothetical protein WJR50_05970 [Catalinimonas sp. 4WD22]|uniref:hypothetical protein n=1 Tax=Catalinimonas locisalis TaxID=3133978 RepID=UPI0031016299
MRNNTSTSRNVMIDFHPNLLYTITQNVMKENNNAIISALFAQAQTYLQNTNAKPEILKRMGMHGFSPKRMQEGDTLLNNASFLHTQKTQKYGEKSSVAAQLKTNEQQARETFMDHVATVKFAFRKEPLILEQFNIKRVSKKINVWPMQARYFYAQANEHVTQLSQHGLTAEELAQGHAMVEAVTHARNQRILTKGEAEEATRLRDQSVKVLKVWMSEFRTIAKIALKDNPQLLESLGITVKTQKV